MLSPVSACPLWMGKMRLEGGLAESWRTGEGGDGGGEERRVEGRGGIRDRVKENECEREI